MIESRKSPTGTASLFVISTIVLSALTTTAVIAITLIRPDTDNSTLITTLVGITGPIIASLVVAAVQQTHLAVNSRMDEFKRLLESVAAQEQSDKDNV